MKVMETLGRHQPTGQKGIFQYRRTPAGVEIDLEVGQAASVSGAVVTITHQDWLNILLAIARAPNSTFRIQASSTGNPPHQDLDSIIQGAAPGVVWNTSLTSAVVAILEHEGTVEHHGGSGGPGVGLPITLRRDP